MRLLFDGRGCGSRRLLRRALLAGLAAPRRPAGTGSSLGSSCDMLVRNFLTPCSSNWTRVYASSTAITDPRP